MKMKSPILPEWRNKGLRKEDGILVGCDSEFELWLPWWYHNYAKYNSFPVTVVNFGMKGKWLQWCSERFEVVDVDIPPRIVEKRIAHISKMKKQDREITLKQCLAWFRKPIALLQSPYQRTLWIDLDCLILGDIAGAFDYAKEPHHIAMAVEESKEKMALKVKEGILNPGEKFFNAGVIAYHHHAEIIELWIREIYEREGYFLGDSDLYSRMAADSGIDTPVLPREYNWLVASHGINSKAKILHFAGTAKPLGYELVKDFHIHIGRLGL